VGAPIFYREVNLPFRDAVNDPSQIRWRFGDVASRQPPSVVLKNLPVCGNCHSFSADGKVLGMDVDYANDKASYAILNVSQEMILEPSKIITWSDYRREDGEITLGLLSQVSPDGQHVASTVKDDSVFVPRPDLTFSQLFFPIKGIVGIYSREDGTFQALPGADDPRYVQSNPVWSPDGKWIVFCKARTYMLLQPDSELYIIPSDGGEARRLRCNTCRMNSWHSWSPNGKWMVFSSKAFSPYTQLFITHMDDAGNSSPPVLLANFTEPGRAANIPEFVCAAPGAIRQISERFIDDHSYARQATTSAKFGDLDRAEASYRKALAFNPKNADALCNLGTILAMKGHTDQAVECHRAALQSAPEHFESHYSLGVQLMNLGHAVEAIKCLEHAVRLSPDNVPARYCLGSALQVQQEFEQALTQYTRILELDRDCSEALAQAALIRSTCPRRELRDYDAAVAMAQRACELTQFGDPESLAILGRAYAQAGRRQEAIMAARQAVELARRSGRADFVRRFEREFQAISGN